VNNVLATIRRVADPFSSRHCWHAYAAAAARMQQSATVTAPSSATEQQTIVDGVAAAATVPALQRFRRSTDGSGSVGMAARMGDLHVQTGLNPQAPVAQLNPLAVSPGAARYGSLTEPTQQQYAAFGPGGQPQVLPQQHQQPQLQPQQQQRPLQQSAGLLPPPGGGRKQESLTPQQQLLLAQQRQVAAQQQAAAMMQWQYMQGLGMPGPSFQTQQPASQFCGMPAQAQQLAMSQPWQQQQMYMQQQQQQQQQQVLMQQQQQQQQQQPLTGVMQGQGMLWASSGIPGVQGAYQTGMQTVQPALQQQQQQQPAARPNGTASAAALPPSTPALQQQAKQPALQQQPPADLGNRGAGAAPGQPAMVQVPQQQQLLQQQRISPAMFQYSGALAAGLPAGGTSTGHWQQQQQQQQQQGAIPYAELYGESSSAFVSCTPAAHVPRVLSIKVEISHMCGLCGTSRPCRAQHNIPLPAFPYLYAAFLGMPGMQQLGMQQPALQQQQQQLQRPQQTGVQASPFVGGGGASGMFNLMMPGLYGCGYGIGMALDPFAAWCAVCRIALQRWS
jgi:hypothetical protein